MNRNFESFPKSSPIRLEPAAYAQLRRKILERDGWRCQLCGAMQNLQIHHQEFRSHSGWDAEENLITLCANCHSAAHSQTRSKKFRRADVPLIAPR